MFTRYRLSSAICLLGILVAAAPVRAGELDRCLPPDTEIFVRVNLKQALDSGIVKKLGIEQIKDAIQGIDELAAAFKELDFDPFTDLETITFAAPNGNEQDRMLVVIHGKFKVEKFKAKAEEVAKDMGDVVKLHKVGDGAGGQAVVYEVHVPDQDQAIFVAVASETTVLVSPGKDYVVDAIKRDKAKAAVAFKNKEFQALLEKMDPKQTLSLAAMGDALKKSLPDVAANFADKIDALGGGITLTDDLKVEIVVGAKTAQEAGELNKSIKDNVDKGMALLGVLAINEPGITPVVDVLKTVRCTAKDKQVTIKAEISAEIMEKLGASARKLLGKDG